MNGKPAIAALCALAACSATTAAEGPSWWNPRWRFRTTVVRPTPYRDDAPRPVEVAVDFPVLMKRAGVRGEFDPASLRVVEPGQGASGREVSHVYRTEFDARQGRRRAYLAWIAQGKTGDVGAYDIYFDTKARGIQPAEYDAGELPPPNLLTNAGFEEDAEGLPAGWDVTPSELVRLGRFAHTTGERSLKIVIDENTPEDAGREVTVSQKVDVRRFAGQAMVFECDLLAERAAYGAPVTVELEQLRADGSRIREYAIQPRWLTVELAKGQLVQFSERGRFSSEAASVNVRVRFRCYVRDADTRETVTGPESFFTLWLDRVVLRPGERWPWPPASHAGFVEGALQGTPLNRGFEFTGQRRLAFNGGSEGTRTAGQYGDAESAHWGLQAGTLEFWCRPLWNADDGVERVLFYGMAYGHRLQSRLRKLGGDGGNQLEFTICDAGSTARTVRGPAPLRAGEWRHIAATWDFPKAHLQLFVDGKLVGEDGPGGEPWPFSLVHTGEGKTRGIGISDTDSRSMPMQAFIGGDRSWTARGAADAVLDEFRISDVARYSGDFAPPRGGEFRVDEHTRALFHFENERHGVHASDDRFVRGYLACEQQPLEQEAALESLDHGKIRRRVTIVKPHASPKLFEANRAETRLTVTRPFRKLPDPRFVERRERRVERTVTGADDGFVLKVGGDLPPLMRSVTFERADGAGPETTLLPRWRANDNVVPFSAATIAATLATDAETDAERAFEVFKYALRVSNYYDAHYCETLPKQHRPRVSYTLIKALNIYPFDQCGPLNHMLRKLFLTAGLSSNNASGTHHQFEQAFYDGTLRLFDLSARVYWLNRDNTTRLSVRGLEDDPYMKLRQGGDANAWIPGRRGRATFGVAERPHSMDFALRPGERVSICWQNEGRWFELTENRKPIPLAKIPPYFGNGAIVYQPTSEGEAAEFDNLVIERTPDGPAMLQAKEPAKVASLIYRAQCPYIFSAGAVSGAYSAAEAGAVRVLLSFDEGQSWTQVWRSPGEAGEMFADLLPHVSARYAYWLKLELAPGSQASVTGAKIRTVFVASPLALPGKLSLGANRISFVGGPPSVPVKTTCSWVERYRTKVRVSLNALSYYNMDDEAHRNLFIVAPGGEAPVRATLSGGRGDVSLEGLPRDWRVAGGMRTAGWAEFSLRPREAGEGEVRGFDVVVRGDGRERRVPAQVLVADAALVREAEEADEASGQVSPFDLAELSAARGMAFNGDGRLAFALTAPHEGKYALWLRARWEQDSSTRMTLALDDGQPRELRAVAMIGFTDWTDPRQAHTKMFAHYGEQYGHWAWYRIPDVELAAGGHRLTLGAGSGARFDALALLPQNPVVDRAAMNLFQNWNYAPWDAPM